jgi:proto-oncogene tyrosine-protein kinase Met
MKGLSNDNVISLIGVIFKQDIPMLITPLMENGELLSYIRDDGNSPQVKDLIGFGIDIANG